MVGNFKLIQIATLAFLFLPCIAQVLTEADDQEIEEKIEEFADNLCSCKTIKGMTLAVVKDDRNILTKSFGYKNLEDKKKADTKTLFGIASLTKAFAAATLVKIFQERNITLQTPIREYLNITFPNKQLNTYVTLEDLLSHRTGIVRNNFLRLNENFTRSTIDKFLWKFHVHKDFRTSFVYNNVMYGLASLITELLTGMSWEDAVSTQLLRPLGMNDTTFSTIADVGKLNVAYPYLKQRKGFKRIPSEFTRKWAELGGTGAMLSSATDMSRWMRFLLNEGELDGKRVMDSEDIENIFKVRNHAGSKKDFMRPKTPITISDDSYSLGWKKGYYRGFPIITHTGSTWGYKAMLTLFPLQKFGIFNAQIGTDDNYIKRRLLHSYIADLYLGEEPWLNQTSACSFPWESSKNDTEIKKRLTRSSPILNMHLFVGLYVNELWGNLRIEMAKNGLKMIYGYGTFTLSPTSKPLEFKATGTKEIWFMTLSSVKFYTEYDDGVRVISVRVSSFEKSKPPKFKKVK